MNELHYIIIFGILIAALSMAGVALIKSHKGVASFIERNLLEFSALSAGVFLVTSFLLIRETLELLPFGEALIAFTIGAIGHVIIHRSFHHHRTHSGSDHEDEHKDKKAAWKVLIGDTIHNIADGLLLVSSFGFGPAIGFSTALSIMAHELPQEISEFLVLKRAGYSTLEASYRNVATSLSIFVGIGIGLVLINTEVVQAYLLGATAMFFIGVIITDLFPITQVVKAKNGGRMTLMLVLGAVIMTLITQSLGHSHIHEDDHDHNHSYEDPELFHDHAHEEIDPLFQEEPLHHDH